MSKSIKKQIEERNAKFEKATNAEKRLLIVTDAFKQLVSGRFVAESGEWLWVTVKDAYDTSLTEDDSLQKCTLSNKVECVGCALGSMMLGLVRFDNKVTLGEATEYSCDSPFFIDAIEKSTPGNGKVGNRLLRYFSENQLNLVEYFFEMGNGVSRHHELTDLEQAIFNYWRDDHGAETWKDEQRLLLILKNMMNNQGMFVPEQLIDHNTWNFKEAKEFNIV